MTIPGAIAEVSNLAECEMILRDRNRGMSVAAIMAKWGISQPTISRRIKVALDANRVDDIDEYREREIMALDDLMQRWEEQLVIAQELGQMAIDHRVEISGVMINIPDEAGVRDAAKLRDSALNGILRVRERRSRLIGIDAPVKVDTKVVHHDAKDLELAEMVSGRKREPATAV